MLKHHEKFFLMYVDSLVYHHDYICEYNEYKVETAWKQQYERKLARGVECKLSRKESTSFEI